MLLQGMAIEGMRELKVYRLTLLGTDAFKLGDEVHQGEARGRVVDVVDSKTLIVGLLSDKPFVASFSAKSDALLTTGNVRRTVGRVVVACEEIPNHYAYVKDEARN